jgi:chromosomal replication initiation ATPase DnaA
MSDVILPDDVRDFILGHIDSVARLEALLLLRNYAELTNRPRSAPNVRSLLERHREAAAKLGFL